LTDGHDGLAVTMAPGVVCSSVCRRWRGALRGPGLLVCGPL